MAVVYQGHDFLTVSESDEPSAMQPTDFDNAAATALDVIYSQQGVPAVFTTIGSTPTTVRLLVEDRSRDTRDKQALRSKVHTLRGSLRISEVESIDKGDTIQLTGETTVFRIIPSSLRNDGLEWDFEAQSDVATTLGEVGTFPTI